MNKNLNHFDRLVSTTDFSLSVNLAPFINGNILPTPAVRIEIYQSLRRLETNATCFEEIFAHQQTAILQITQILKEYEAAYAKTRSEQLRVQEITDRHRHALSSPIRSLPDDLLAVIFGLADPNAAFMGLFPWVATGPSHDPTTFFGLPSVYSQTIITPALMQD
ncbi:uncharacterized protein ARMOST_18584 [Armillaria ostoyae]|uniref:Uncharacterized protein n=1 Tax=Armillaria ostoyae TaxID=47428 RepID=A0A284S242_ARMOS|nr:uncharacterized protein ARMOST_18584 [Armillaria ostoyae]